MSDSNALHTSLVDVSCAFEPPRAADLPDDELIILQQSLAEIRRRVDTASATVAAEIAHRSRRDLGSDGLAQRLGARTPERLVQRLTGTSARDANAMVRVGTLMTTPTSLTDAPLLSPGEHSDAAAGAEVAGTPWLAPVAAAVAAAQLSLDAAEAIRAGLGVPDSEQPTEAGGGRGHDDGDGVGVGVSVAQLAEAAERLVVEARGCTVEQLAARARDARAELDAAADASRVTGHEQALRDRRYLYLSRQPDGMTRLSGLLDPESAALVRDAVDAATSPRRGGPRFLSDTERDRAERLLHDTRTIEQLALDALVELVRLGGEVAPAALIGVRAPSVQVIVAESDLRSGRGLARLEGQSEPVSIDTARRHECSAGSVPIVIDARGDVVALGRETRLYTRRQRIALAARDGGCRFPRCERPPSWTEAHHIVPWSEGGATDLDTGVLLCRHHHLLLHNNGWRFSRVDGELVVIPPASVDREQRPIPAPSKNPLVDGVRRAIETG